MGESSLKDVRLPLKIGLANSRAVLTSGWFYPLCAYCNKPDPVYRFDMHEVLLTRNDVRGNKELLPAIMVPQNCVLVHHNSCHLKCTSKEGKRIVTAHLIEWEGVDRILGWLSRMSKLMTSNEPKIKSLLVEDVYDEMQKLR